MIYKTENNLKSIIMKRLFLAVAALAALVSCNRGNELVPSQNFRNVSIVAKSAETKTVLDGDAVKWEANDEIKVRFDKTDVSPSTSHFETFTTAQGGATATFAGTLPNDVSQTGGYDATGYAVYPATAMDDNGTVSFTLPYTRNVASGSFPSGQNLSSATVSLNDLNTSGSATATFKNAFAILRFTLDPNIKSVKITASENLAGQASMKFTDVAEDAGRLVVDNFSDGKNTLTLTPSEGDETFDATKAYNILVYPGTHTALSVEMVDKDGCVYTKEISGNYSFAAANYYTFNFNYAFVKVYSFAAAGRTFNANEEIAVVYNDATAVVQEAIAEYVDEKFTVNQIAAVAHGEDITGYAVYPATAYDSNNDKITYTLSAEGPLTELYSAKLGDETVTFNSVESALAKVTFTAPAGVKSVTITSDMGLVGEAVMTVNDEGKLVADEGSIKTVTVSTPDSKEYTINVYPVSGADLTVTLIDAANDTVEKEMTLTVAAGATQNLDLSGDLNFDKNGTFKHEGFVDGNGNDEAIVF